MSKLLRLVSICAVLLVVGSVGQPADTHSASGVPDWKTSLTPHQQEWLEWLLSAARGTWYGFYSGVFRGKRTVN